MSILYFLKLSILSILYLISIVLYLISIEVIIIKLKWIDIIDN